MGALAVALKAITAITIGRSLYAAATLVIGRQTVNHPANNPGEKNMRLLLATTILSLSAITACSGGSTAGSTATAVTAAPADSAQTILDRHVAAMAAQPFTRSRRSCYGLLRQSHTSFPIVPIRS